MKTGVVVNKVFADSAAQQAGLKPGEIVTKIDGVFVRDPQIAVDLVSESAAGERVSLTVIDTTGGGIRQSDVFATLAANPPSDFPAIMTAKPKARLRHVPTSSKVSHCVGSASTQDRPCRAGLAAEH